MAEADKISTFLGEGTEPEGELKLCRTLRLDGHFEEKISGEGTLIVGEGAKIESDIHVSKILNSGEILGNVIADKRIEIHAPGKIIGSIQTPVLVMDEGAINEGGCSMDEGEERALIRLTVVGSGESNAESKEVRQKKGSSDYFFHIISIRYKIKRRISRQSVTKCLSEN
jgi:cytoskeletal protein CcmA (bactofilin family)